MITCSAQDFGSGVMVSANVQIILIGNNHGAVNSRLGIKLVLYYSINDFYYIIINTVTQNVNISQSFEGNGVTVALEWDPKNGVSYIVGVQPEVLVDYT